MKEEVKEFKLGELFCGPGGLAYAAINAKIEKPEYRIVHKWANDYDLDTCNTYRRNICPDAKESVICGDVRKLDIELLGDIDALAFGFPCNDFSVVGEQKGFDGTFGPLYTYGVKVLKKYQPLWFMAENVGGLKSANEGKAFEKIKKDLIKAGYKIYPNLYIQLSFIIIFIIILTTLGITNREIDRHLSAVPTINCILLRYLLLTDFLLRSGKDC